MKLYQGAGALIHSVNNNSSYILLGLRRHGWDSNLWSIFGGKKERYDKDFWECAKRETAEELHSHIDIVPETYTDIHKISLPVFEWQTFLCGVNYKPLYKNPSYNEEFFDIQWFRLDSLPDNLHPFLKKSLEYFDI